MESHQDMEIVDRIYMKIGNPELLVSAADHSELKSYCLFFL